MESFERTQILVVGGGPAGSTAATFLAREGAQVTLVERDHFPRYHIGESLLPSCLEILELMGARDLVENHGFQRKTGAFLDWKGEQWILEFGELAGNYQHSFQVLRSEFDQLLLDHARRQGVTVFEGMAVREVEFDGDRPISAICGDDHRSLRISFDYLIDASGRTGVLSNRYLRNRRVNDRFQNVAIWGYWEGVSYPPEARTGDITVGSTPDGWNWSIPFSDGKTSIGAVVDKGALRARGIGQSMTDVYYNSLASSPLISRMVASAKIISDIKVEQDYSYCAETFAGPGYFLAGDSACFLDPLLSTGVHLAMYSAMLAAASILTLMKGEVSELDATMFYEDSYRRAYSRFLVFVASFYETSGKAGYYQRAEQLSHFDADPMNIRRAFVNLVSGLEDIAEAEMTTEHLMGEMSRRIRQNLNLRKDKQALKDKRSESKFRDNSQFFGAIEGLSLLSPNDSINGFYIQTKPALRISRTN